MEMDAIEEWNLFLVDLSHICHNTRWSLNLNMVSCHRHSLHLSPSDCHPMLTNISTVNGRYNICRHISSGSFGMMSLVSKILQVSLSSLNVSRRNICRLWHYFWWRCRNQVQTQSSKYLHLKNEYIVYKSIGNHIRYLVWNGLAKSITKGCWSSPCLGRLLKIYL
jgi:hypothetical protein